MLNIIYSMEMIITLSLLVLMKPTMEWNTINMKETNSNDAETVPKSSVQRKLTPKEVPYY